MKEVLEAKPEVIVVGTGYHGEMSVPRETRKHIEFEGIELIIKKTTEACETFDRLVTSRKVLAVFYLTC